MSPLPSMVPDPNAPSVRLVPDARKVLRTIFSGRFRWLLGTLVVLMILMPPLTTVTLLVIPNGPSLALSDVVAALMVVLAVVAYFATRGRLVLLALLAVTLTLAAFARHMPELREPCGVSALLLYGLIIAVIGVRLGIEVFSTSDIDGDVICGAISIYILTGLSFGAVYSAILLDSPDAFSIAENLRSQDAALGPHRIMLYFSLSTLTTAGYGDITPVSDLARSLTNLQAVTGPVYLAVVMARLVSLQIARATVAPSP